MFKKKNNYYYIVCRTTRMLKLKITLQNGLEWSNPRSNGNLMIQNKNLTIGQIMFRVRMLLAAIDASEAIYLFVNNTTLVCNNESLIFIFNKYNINNVLHITATKENVFGSPKVS